MWETRELAEKPVPVPLYSPQIPHGPFRESNSGLLSQKQATYCLMALKTKIQRISSSYLTENIVLPLERRTHYCCLGK